MNAILRDPPAFFNRGPSPLARFTFFALVAVAAMVADHHFRALDSVRFAIATVVEPVKRTAAWPIDQAKALNQYLVEQKSLISENESLKLKVTEYAREAQMARQLQTDQLNLQGLTNLKAKHSNLGVIAEVLYGTSASGSNALILDKGAAAGVRAGMAVIDADGLIGQVIRIGPTTSEVALVTQKDHPIPVMVGRNNLRAITQGTGRDGALEVPYLATAADIREGDILLTSGIDGTYPPGLAVGRVNKIEKQGGPMFAKVSVTPLAGVDRNRFALVLTGAARDETLKADIKPELTEKVKQSRAAVLAEQRRRNVGQ